MTTEIKLITRKDYMGAPFTTKEDAEARHRAYYAQLVSEQTISHVVAHIGKKALLDSKGTASLSDIPLHQWDGCFPTLKRPFRDLGDYPTIAGRVCVAKEAARQWLERQRNSLRFKINRLSLERL